MGQTASAPVRAAADAAAAAAAAATAAAAYAVAAEKAAIVAAKAATAPANVIAPAIAADIAADASATAAIAADAADASATTAITADAAATTDASAAAAAAAAASAAAAAASAAAAAASAADAKATAAAASAAAATAAADAKATATASAAASAAAARAPAASAAAARAPAASAASARAPAAASAAASAAAARAPAAAPAGVKYPEKKTVLLDHSNKFMAKTSNSADADTLDALLNREFASAEFVAKFPSEKLPLYKNFLKKVAFVASILTRGKPKLPSSDVAKSTRGKQRSFCLHGFHTLVRLCSSELLSIIPEGKWTDRDAASFLQTLESIDPILSSLFTKVFDDLIDHKEQLQQVFSSDFFHSFLKVVRPNSLLGCPESTVQHDYGLKYHYRFPMTSKQLFASLRRELAAGEV
jgi:hypothetical protein